ncbi:MAG: type II toxin-antitoxin system RelE/ParE family toxin [Pseudomonadales bacterium]
MRVLPFKRLDLPGFRLHALKGDQQNRWSIRVNGNWRVTFSFSRW